MSGDSDNAIVVGEINDINEQPESKFDRFATDAGKSVRGDILANDTDPEGDNLFADLVKDVENGNLVLQPNGEFTYTPNDGFVGVDRFRYRAFDGKNFGNPVQVIIVVNTANLPSDPPGEEPQPEIDPPDDPELPESDPPDDPFRGTIGSSEDGDSKSGGQPKLDLFSNASNFEFANRLNSNETIEVSKTNFLTSQFVVPSTQQLRHIPEVHSTQFATYVNSNLEVLFGDTNMSDELVALNQGIEVQPLTQSVAVATAASVTSALTVGYVVWLVRSGFLLASMMSSLPAWKLADPLSFLECLSESEDGETLESILEKSELQ